MSKLATIQIIKSIEPIEGADNILCAKFEDIFWQSVIKKDQFSVGEKVVYIMIDTVLPDGAAWAQFLKGNSAENEPIRLKSAKLRGCLSQGLVLPLSVLNETDASLRIVGEDVAELIGVIKYEKPIHGSMLGEAKGNFPNHIISKTDEERIQNCPKILGELHSKSYYISLKMDGQSGTFFKLDGELRVCSRNLELKESESSFWRLADKYKLKEVLPEGYAIQAECCGEKINGNKMAFSELQFFVFNVFDIVNRKYLDFADFKKFCSDNNLPTVPILETGEFLYTSIGQLLDYADKLNYDNGSPAEGIVIRPVFESFSSIMAGRMSFKVISNRYLLKHKE